MVAVERKLSNGCLMRVVEGDITKLQVDAVVNAANSSLMGGGGVDGAIHRAGGPAILEQCRKIVGQQGHLRTGRAVVTTAGKLAARCVIHTVGPVYSKDDRGDAALLQSCYRESLKLALESNCRSVAFPGISTGVYGYPLEKAAPLAVEAVTAFLEEHGAPAEVIFCTFESRATDLYREILG